MAMTRRQLLQVGAFAGATVLVPVRWPAVAGAAVPPGMTMFTEALPTVNDLGVIDATGGGSATITMVNAQHQFHSALAPTPTFAYQGGAGGQTYLGPVIVARQ